jgi:hypothetical protein
MGTTAIIAMNNLDAHRAMVIAHRTNDAFATGLLTASIKALKAELAKRIVRVTFLKKDGTITSRNATTTPSYAGQFINGAVKSTVVPVQHQRKQTADVENDHVPAFGQIFSAKRPNNLRIFPQNMEHYLLLKQRTDSVAPQYIQKQLLLPPIAQKAVNAAVPHRFIGDVAFGIQNRMIDHGIDHIGFAVVEPVEYFAGKTGASAKIADGDIIIRAAAQHFQHIPFKITLLLRCFFRSALTIHKNPPSISFLLDYKSFSPLSMVETTKTKFHVFTQKAQFPLF